MIDGGEHSLYVQAPGNLDGVERGQEQQVNIGKQIRVSTGIRNGNYAGIEICLYISHLPYL